MLPVRSLFFLACLFLAAALTAQVPGELAIVNPGFESGDLSGWAMWPGDDPRVSIVTDVVASGENAAKISGGTGSVYKVVSDEINLVPGTFYCFVADVINPSADPLQEGQSVYFASKVTSPSGEVWFQSAQTIDSSTEADVWNRLSFGLTYPADATELTVEFKWTGTGAEDPGSVVVDDIKVIRMEPMEEVSNLGFEDTEDSLFAWDGGWWTWSYLPVDPPVGTETWLDDTVSRTGNWSLGITTQDWYSWSDDWWWGGYYSWTGYTVRDTVNFYNAGDNFYMSAWVMTPSSDPLEGAANVRLELTFKDNHDKNTSDLGYDGRKYSGAQLEEGWTVDEWHFLEGYIQAPEWAAEDTINRIDFNIVLSQFGEAFGIVYADDIFIARGVTSTSAVKSDNNSVPLEFALSQNYPNPFNPTTTITFDLVQSSETTLSIFNIRGEKVADLVSENLPAGRHSYNWNAADRPSGAYFYKLETGGFSKTRKMLLIR